jgi:hypothetical protein
MVTRLGERCVSFEEIDEKDVSVLHEPNDLFDVRVRKGAIDNLSNLTARGDLHDLLFEIAEGKERGLIPFSPKDEFGLMDQRDDTEADAVKRRCLAAAEAAYSSLSNGHWQAAAFVAVAPLPVA